MGRNPFSFGLLSKTVLFSVAFLTLFAPLARANDDDDIPLRYFKNYFVTGDYAVAGVGLRGTGVNGYATGNINMNLVPCTSRPAVGDASIVSCTTPGSVPADIVAAFLYWETEETTSAPSSINGYFRGNAIVGKVLGSPDNRACLSSGGSYGSSQGKGRVYRADVLRYLPIDHTNNIRLANGPHVVKLRDSGGNGNGNTPYTNGATLVVVYRIVVPGQPRIAPLRAVVSYDGAFTLNKSSDTFTLKVGGFYQASPAAAARMTPIVGNGQSNFRESLYLTTGFQTATYSDPFKGSTVTGGRWDNPTYPLNLAANSDSYTTRVIAGNNQVCLTFAAIWTSTKVVDTDFDGLLDIWETKGLHLDPGNDHHAATFGDCYKEFDDDDYHHDYDDDHHRQPCVDLKAMGALPNKPDIFLEIDWMQGTDADGHSHLHIPKYSALNAMGQTFASHGIALHIDMGPLEYLGSPFIIPAAYARGGNVIDEASVRCRPISTATITTTCAFSEPYSVLSWKKGLHAVKDGFNVLGIDPHFDHNRKDIFHYVLFAHALAGPFDSAGVPLTPDPSSVSGVADRPGGDIMITLGLWRYDDPVACNPRIDCADHTGNAQVQAGTFMHELGHNLGLSHAGNYRFPNCIPIYPSVMNYLYQTRGLTDAAGFGHIDFSSGLLRPLDERNLSEEPGSLGPLSYRIRFYGPRLGTEGTAGAHCDGTSIGAGERAVRLETPGVGVPDWNRNRILDRPSPQDVNYNGSLADGVRGGIFFVDSNDWSSLNLQQVGSRRNVNGLSSDIGEADLGEADLGEADLGEADLGEADLGEADLGEADLGEADLGEADLGEASFTMDISSPDATSSSQPLTAVSTSSAISLAWGAPSIGQVRRYNIYRSDPAHPVAFLIGHVDGAPPTPTFSDPVNDFTHSRESCPDGMTCYNTTYTYYVTSVIVNSADPSGFTESGGSTTFDGKVKHLFVVPDSQVAVYGAPLPSLTFKVYSDVLESLPGASCAFTISPAVPRNADTYSIACTGPAASGSVGVTYNALYYDGPNVRTLGTLTITRAPLTITASTNTKTYDATTAAAAVPVVSGLQYSDTVTGLAETYDTPNSGMGKTLSVSPGYIVNDLNSGNNYTVTPVLDLTGVINKAVAIVVVTPYSVTYDASPHTAAITSITGVAGEMGAIVGAVTLNTTHTNAGTYAGDSWSFTGGINYKDIASTIITDRIYKANATVIVAGYFVDYDGNPHTATVSTIAGVAGESGATVGTVSLSTTHINAGVYSSDSWSFTGTANYNNIASTTITDIIYKVTPVFSNLASPAILAGSTPTALGGKLAYGSLIPSGVVKITVNSTFQSPAITAGGLFSANFTTGAFAVGSYPISYHYDGDINFNPPADGAGTLTVMGFTPTGSMIVKRSNHTASLLPDGTVLIAGGFEPGDGDFDDDDMLSSAEIYNPATGTSSLTTGSMPSAVARHTATLLGTGKVLIAGGRTSSTRLYNPATKTFAATGAMSTSRSDHTATLLPNGKVLITGGANNSNTTLNTATLYDPVTGTFSATGNMLTPRELQTATLLGNGKVLIVGGRKTSGSSYVALSSAEVYDPATGVFTATGAMPDARYGHIASLLPSGKVLIAGGTNGASDLATAVLFDAGSGSYAATGSLIKPRRFATATILNDGTILVVGGRNGSTTLNSAELYSAGNFSLTANMGEARYSQTATLLTNGKVLVTGGVGSAGLPINRDELFNSGP